MPAQVTRVICHDVSVNSSDYYNTDIHHLGREKGHGKKGARIFFPEHKRSTECILAEDSSYDLKVRGCVLLESMLWFGGLL